MTQQFKTIVRLSLLPYWLAMTVLVVAVFWAYWPTMGGMAQRWHEPQYSHGYLVPFFALFILWWRRAQLAAVSLRPCWWGALLLGLGFGLRLIGAYFFFDWIDEFSLIPLLGGLCLLLGGLPALRWSWPAIAFLLFMLPLPFTVEVGLAHPLQRLATLTSTYVLQTLGFPALAEGNIIRLGEVRINVVEACSGLSMLVTFFALSTTVALVIRRAPLDKILVVLSAIPLAVIANVARITVTGVLYKTVGSHAANHFFHDLAGWFMMPLALALLWVELKLLSRMWAKPVPVLQKPVAMPGVTGVQRPPRKQEIPASMR